MTDLSCKIVIKAANQKYEDFHVDIPEPDWTIKRLKQHLAENYPSNPACDSIRLIYSGKLLHDHWTLKECLRQNHQSSHMIHIVLPASANSNTTAKAAGSSPGPRSSSTAAAAADDHHFNDDELTPGSSSNSDADGSTSSSDSSTPVQSTTASEFVTNPLNTFNQLQNNLNNLLQQQQRRQQQQQYEQLSSKEQYNMIHDNLLRYYESMGVPVQSNSWYSAYIQHLALYNYMYTNYLQSIGVIGAPSPAPASSTTTTTQEAAPNERPLMAEDNQAPPAQPAAAAAAPARPAAPAVNQAALGGAAQDMGDREDDWLGVLHNICSFLILFSIIYYYSSFERFVLIFSIVFILILYHKGWLTLQRRPAANRRNAPPNRPAPAQDQGDAAGGQQPANNNNEGNEPGAGEGVQAPAPVNPGTLRLILTFVFTFFTSLVPERPQGAA